LTAKKSFDCADILENALIFSNYEFFVKSHIPSKTVESAATIFADIPCISKRNMLL